MALFEQFPYTNFHEMNLDWALRVAESAQEHLDGYDEDMATIAQNVLDTESWKNAAAGSASAAAGSALAASGSAASAASEALEAEAWAKGTKNGAAVAASAPQYQNNSKYFSQQSADQALEAEAWADGEKNGTPVGSSAQQYENNAKYWSEQAYIQAQAGAEAGIDPYKPYSIGACVNYVYNNPNGIKVKASRTVTKQDGTTESVNYSGLIAFLEPTDTEDENLIHSGDITAQLASLHIISVTANNGEYIGFNYTMPNVYEVENGVKHRVLMFRMYNITTGQYLADDTTIYRLSVIATNAAADIPHSDVRNGDVGQDLS